MKPASEMDPNARSGKCGSRNSSRNDETAPSTPDAEVIAARLAEFDRDFPIPYLGHGH
jgi:hypothetical protein